VAVAEAAGAYCQQHGGTVQTQQPTFGTNNGESTWVALGQPVQVCQFQSGTGANNSRIYTDLVTLYSEQPTLAALAYLAKKKTSTTSNGANPATAGCTALGASTAFGPSLNGGGLVDKESKADPVVSPCTFADGSFIDEWGIAYYSGGVVRGADLAPLFRFDKATAPKVFSQ